MQKTLLRRCRKAWSRRPVIAGALLGLFVVTLSVTYFEALHCSLHSDADDPAHQCAVSLLKQGLLDAAETTVPMSVRFAERVSPVLRGEVLIASLINQLPRGRAPPATLV